MRRATDQVAAITYLYPAIDVTTAALARTLGTAVAIGAVIGVLARVAEASHLALGPYSLSGNGALVVPAVLAPAALFLGWAKPLRRHGPPWTLAMVLYLLGLELGIAVGQAVAGGNAEQGLAMGAAFLVPDALVAAITVTALRRMHVDLDRSVLIGAFVASLVIGSLPVVAIYGGVGSSGIAIGASAISGSRSRPRKRVLLAAALLGLMLVTVFLSPLALSIR